MEIDWVSGGIKSLLGFKPYPGTLNVEISERDFKMLMDIIKREGQVLKSPLPQFCNAILLKARIGEISCACIFPEESVWVHKNTLEVVAPFKLREILDLQENAEVEIDIQRTFVPDAVIFDVDGTLVDSVGFFYELAKMLLKPYSISPLLSDLKDIMNKGLSPWAMLIPHGIPERERIIEEIRRKDAETFPVMYAKLCQILPGVNEVIRTLKMKGIKTALVTTSWHLDAVDSVFKKSGIDVHSLFDHISGIDPYSEKKKGIKETLEEAISRLSVSNLRTVYVGDAIVNIAAGKELGLTTIGVLTGVGREDELSEAGADAILKDLTYLLEKIDEID